MDGTLVDTEPYWIAAEYALIEEHGGTWSDEHAMNLVGSDLIDSGRYLREHSGIDLEPAEIVEELLDRVVVRMGEQIPWRDGAVELLDSLREDGTPCALVTMSYRRFVTPMLDALPPGTFRAVVTGDAVSRGKPHPEPYLTAARHLRLAPEHCLAIEDSNTGAAPPRRPEPRCWWYLTTCPCCRGIAASSATRSPGCPPVTSPRCVPGPTSRWSCAFLVKL